MSEDPSLIDRAVNAMTDVTVELARGDLPISWLERRPQGSILCVDIETSGLSYIQDEIGSIQVFDGVSRVCVVRPPFSFPRALVELLACEEVRKVFHHAMFDLRFLAHKFGAKARNIACTKIAAKVIYPGENSSLEELVARFLRVRLDKSQRLSNWSSPDLSDAQMNYAIGDVIHLRSLLSLLLMEAERQRVGALIQRSFEYLPVRVELDLRQVGDVFKYH